jgi:hypothetical protein
MARSTSATMASLEQPLLQPIPIATVVLLARWKRYSFLPLLRLRRIIVNGGKGQIAIEKDRVSQTIFLPLFTAIMDSNKIQAEE